MSCCEVSKPFDLSVECDPAKKSLLNNKSVSVNQLMPLKYGWAWEHYLNGCANHWLPTEVSMQRDIELWRSNKLTELERKVILRNLGFFSTGESLVGNNIVLAIFRHVTNPEARQYLLRQSFEEAIHTHAFHYIVESLGLDGREVFNMHSEVSSIKGKDDFVMSLTQKLLDPNAKTETDAEIRELVRNLVGFYVIMEGLFFYSGFAMILSLHRQNKMTGIGEQFQYILRDETTHLNFGIDLINGIKEEHPGIWNEEFKLEIQEMIDKAVGFEIEYAKECIGNGFLGLTLANFESYVKFIADRRLERIGLQRQYNTKNPFTWMSETIDLPKEKNFFETRVTEYQSSGSLTW